MKSFPQKVVKWMAKNRLFYMGAVVLLYFLPILASASVLYSQTNSNSSAVDLHYGSNTAVLGAFSVTATSTLADSALGASSTISFQYTSTCDILGMGVCGGGGYFWISTSSDPTEGFCNGGCVGGFEDVPNGWSADSTSVPVSETLFYTYDPTASNPRDFTQTIPPGLYFIHAEFPYALGSWSLSINTDGLSQMYGTLLDVEGVSSPASVSSLGFPDSGTYIPNVTTTGLPPGVTFFNQYATSTLATSTLVDTTNLLSFINVPQLLATRVPFAYIFQIYGTFTTAMSTSTSGALLPNSFMTFVWPTAFGNDGQTTATSSIALDTFSTTTITQYIGPTDLAIIRELLVAIIYVEVGFWIWNDARHKKHLF